MSSRALFRNPTWWRGLSPGLPGLEDADGPLAAAIEQATGIRGRVRLARFDDAQPRYARLDPDASELPLFLKVIPRPLSLHMQESEELARWLAAQGQPVNACLAGFPRPFDQDHMLFAYAYREGRRVHSDERDLEALGRALAGLHQALAGYPGRERLEAATERRLTMLLQARSELASGQKRASPDAEALQRLAREPALDFHSRPAGATPLHDDLNPGNLLMTGADERPFFLDFEDALHGVLPVIYDLALVLERFVAAAEREDSRAIELGRIFLSAYRAGGGAWSPAGEDELATCLRARALRSLCTLALSEWSGVPVVKEEWAKFFSLEQLARERETVLRLIWKES